MVISEDVVLQGNIRLQRGNTYIDVIDSNGNLNARIKNIIRSGIPNENSLDGFYSNGTNIYAKIGNDIINITGSSSSNLPSGTIMLYKGTTPPSGWYLYDVPTGIYNMIYITNDPLSNPELAKVKLNWRINGNNVTVLNVNKGESFVLPELAIEVNGEIGVVIDYFSLDTSVATVDANGNITPIKNGHTLIIAKTEQNAYHNYAVAALSVNVSDYETISLSWGGSVSNGETLSVNQGDSISVVPTIYVTGTSLTQDEFKKSNITYIKDNDDDGIIKSIGKDSKGDLILTLTGVLGSAKIIANCLRTDEHSSALASFYLSVEDLSSLKIKISNIEFVNTSRSISVGEGYSPLLRVRDMSGGLIDIKAEEVHYSTDDDSVVTINGTTIIGKNPGTANISIYVSESSIHTDGKNKYDDLSITVIGSGLLIDADSLNTIINRFNNSGISKQIIASEYLQTIYNYACEEFDENTHGFYDEENFPEIYNGDGCKRTNNTYAVNGTSKNIMLYWLMAMCISELIPTSGTNNNLTKLFKTAYNICGGKSIKLYDNYTVKADPMIARLVAGAIYAYYYEELNDKRTAARNQLGTSLISGGNWKSLLYTNETGDIEKYKNTKMTNPGYLVNTLDFLPGAFGPWNKATSDTLYNSFPYGTTDDYYTDSSDFWKNNNYVVDCKIDDYITNNYVAYTRSGSSYTFKTPTNYVLKEINQRLVEAAAIARSTDFNYFGKKRVKFVGVTSFVHTSGSDNYNITRLKFDETNDSVSNTNNVYDVEGPFSSLLSIMFTGGTKQTFSQTVGGQNVSLSITLFNKTSYMTFLGTIMSIADNSRFPTISNYKRKRPNGGSGSNSLRVNVLLDPRGGFENGSLSAIFADNNNNNFINLRLDASQTDFPGDNYGASYPSGHSALVWTLAMYLGQMNPSLITTYMRNAYRFAVNRTIAKFHWNSDVIYGRLFGTLILPILNAMSGLKSNYNSLKSKIGSGSNVPTDKGSASVTPNTGGGSGSSSTIDITISNYTDSTITIGGTRNTGTYRAGRILFGLSWGENDTGNQNGPVIYLLKSGTITIPSLGRVTFEDIDISEFSQYLGKSFASLSDLDNYMSLWPDSPKQYSNILYYSLGTGLVNVKADNTMSSDIVFNSGYVYNIAIGGHYNSYAGKQSSPTQDPSLSESMLTISNTSGSDLVLSNRMRFIVNNGSTNIRTGNIIIGEGNTTISNNKNFTINIGNLSSISGFGNNFANIPSTGWYDGEDAYYSNIILYTPGQDGNPNGLALSPYTPSISSSSKFVNGSYVINYGGGYVNPDPPGLGLTTGITFDLTLENKCGRDAYLNGEIYFYLLLANPTKDSIYDNTGKGKLKGGIVLPGFVAKEKNSLVIPNNGSYTFESVTISDAQFTTKGLTNKLTGRGVRSDNLILYTYGQNPHDIDPVTNEGKKYHINRLFICDFVKDENDPSTQYTGAVLENGGNYSAKIINCDQVIDDIIYNVSPFI